MCVKAYWSFWSFNFLTRVKVLTWDAGVAYRPEKVTAMGQSLKSQVALHLRRTAKGAAVIGAGVFCLGAISLFSTQPLQTFFWLLSLASAAAMLLSVGLMLLKFRNARSIDAVSMLLALVVTVISTILSIWLSGVAMSMWIEPALEIRTVA
jgi:hypothetical protein